MVQFSSNNAALIRRNFPLVAGDAAVREDKKSMPSGRAGAWASTIRLLKAAKSAANGICDSLFYRTKAGKLILSAEQEIRGVETILIARDQTSFGIEQRDLDTEVGKIGGGSLERMQERIKRRFDEKLDQNTNG